MISTLTLWFHNLFRMKGFPKFMMPGFDAEDMLSLGGSEHEQTLTWSETSGQKCSVFNDTEDTYDTCFDFTQSIYILLHLDSRYILLVWICYIFSIFRSVFANCFLGGASCPVSFVAHSILGHKDLQNCDLSWSERKFFRLRVEDVAIFDMKIMEPK